MVQLGNESYKYIKDYNACFNCDILYDRPLKHEKKYAWMCVLLMITGDQENETDFSTWGIYI